MPEAESKLVESNHIVKSATVSVGHFQSHLPTMLLIEFFRLLSKL